MMLHMAAKLDRISRTLEKMLKARGLGNRLSEYHVFRQWTKTVGPVIAQHAQPQQLRGKKLTLVVDSPAWMQQLSLLRPEIMGKMNKELGTAAIDAIALKLGEVVPQEGPTNSPAELHVQLDEGEREWIENCIRGILDPETKAAVKRVMVKDSISKKKMQQKQQR